MTSNQSWLMACQPFPIRRSHTYQCMQQQGMSSSLAWCCGVRMASRSMIRWGLHFLRFLASPFSSAVRKRRFETSPFYPIHRRVQCLAASVAIYRLFASLLKLAPVKEQRLALWFPMTRPRGHSTYVSIQEAASIQEDPWEIYQAMVNANSAAVRD